MNKLFFKGMLKITVGSGCYGFPDQRCAFCALTYILTLTMHCIYVMTYEGKF